MICLLVMTDGRRDCISETLPSAATNLHEADRARITRRIIHDDSGDPTYRAWLADTFPDFEIIGGDERLGFGRAIDNAWAHTAGRAERFVFHLEDDFTFNRPVRLDDLATVLDTHSELVQLALLRQPWNPEERAVGGIIQQHPECYQRREFWLDSHRPVEWLEHRRFFTTNPSLYRTSLCALGWPDVEHSEGIFTHELLADPLARFAFFGHGQEWVTHIGRERVGHGY